MLLEENKVFFICSQLVKDDFAKITSPWGKNIIIIKKKSVYITFPASLHVLRGFGDLVGLFQEDQIQGLS